MYGVYRTFRLLYYNVYSELSSYTSLCSTEPSDLLASREAGTADCRERLLPQGDVSAVRLQAEANPRRTDCK